MTTTRTDGRIARGNQTRQVILRRAVEIASVEGLEGLSLGRLAGELGLSKSGVFALFGSKEELQLATVRTAIKIYIEYVVQPNRELPLGDPPGCGACASAGSPTPNSGSSPAAASSTPSRRSTTHARARSTTRPPAPTAAGSPISSSPSRRRRDAGEVHADIDIPQLAFELVALLEMANSESVLHANFTCYARAAERILNRLRAVATEPSLLPDSP